MKPETPTPIERQAQAALQRINAQINRSAGQHIRAVRRALPVDQITPKQPSAGVYRRPARATET